MEKQRFLITGGSQGIGAALVELARGEGHDVVFTGRNQELIDKVQSNTGAYGIRADVSDGEDNQRTVDSCLEVMGGIDVLINNAGFGYLGDLGQIEMSKMKELFDTNVFGLVDMGNRVVPLLKTQQSGAIINIASTSGTKGAKGQTVYAGSKWAVRGITQGWQDELRPPGIRVR
ncbi:MAG: SDR family oxidoreductase, partial [Gammaproteobacteria bacterium]|nr:SDR family oxidoreductase [Gammaproteobacteria bacterium]